MKIIILLVLTVLFSGNLFSQSKNAYKTEDVFSISFIDHNGETVKLEDVRLTAIDSTSLSFDEVTYGQTTEQNKYKPRAVLFDRIKSFGYKNAASREAIIRNGAFVGFGIGFVLGFAVGKISFGCGGGESTFQERLGMGAGVGLLIGLPVTAIATLCSIGMGQYDNLDISDYNTNKKFDVIKKLIKKGVKKNS